jgi:hypothetical protein
VLIQWITQPTNTFCGKNTQLLDIKAGGMYRYQCVLKGEHCIKLYLFAAVFGVAIQPCIMWMVEPNTSAVRVFDAKLFPLNHFMLSPLQDSVI